MSESIVSNSPSNRNSCVLPGYPVSGPAAAYAFLRHTCLVLDELCAQGLCLWQDQDNWWRWSWQGTDLAAPHGFWAMGEAVLDAVATRFPDIFHVPSCSYPLHVDR